MVSEEAVFKALIVKIIGSSSDRISKAHFGLTIEVIAALYSDLTDFWDLLDPPLPTRLDMLYALHFLRVYPTEDQVLSFWRCSPNTWRPRVWRTLKAMSMYLPEV